MKVAFNGIYDIRFPKNTPDTEIDEKCLKLRNYISSSNLSEYAQVGRTITPEGTLGNKIRLVTQNDCPHFVELLLKQVDRHVADQYIEKTAMVLDVKA